MDVAAYCEGRAPEADDEVAVDRVFAANNGLAIGDAVELEGRAYTVCDIMTQPDSQALFLNNSDFTVNTITFGVAEVTDAGFAALEDAGGAPTYTYSFTFKNRDLSVAERADAEKDMVEALTDADARVDDLIDADSNQGIGYARDDVDGDSAMWTTLLDIIIVIMAFVFVVLTDASIEEESAIIGTLLASGYRRSEIVAHYLTLPAVVGVIAALTGTALGVAFFTEPMRELYYGSYSLPPFEVFWDWGIFVKCAVVPAAVLILITLLGLLRKMGKTPLQFLRHEAGGKSGTKRGVRLPERLGFVARFRLRVFPRNLGNFATMFMGICFGALLLLFALAVLPTMTHYADNLETSLAAQHQYTLKAPLELEGTADGAHPVNTADNGADRIAQAEKHAVYQLQYDHGKGNGTETATVYGIKPDSRYWKGLDVGDTTPDDMRAIGDQFVDMMDSMIGMMVGLAVFIFLLFMHLLTKAVIDRSARSISYMKVFGYRDGEISRLYIRSITLCVAASLVLCQPLIICGLTAIFRSMFLSYRGNIEIYVPWWSMAATAGIGLLTYLAVAALHTRSIRRVSLSEALKVQE